MKYLSLYKTIIRINLRRELQFRTNLSFHFVTMFINFLGNVMFYYFIYNNVKDIAGWSKYEILILASTVIIVNSIFGGVFFFNMIQVPRKVKNYDLDYMLLKPVSTVFLVSCSEFSLGLFLGVVFGIALFVYSLISLGMSIGLFNILNYIFLVINGVLILYSILLLMVTYSLRFVKINGLIQTFWAIVSVGNNPYSIYPKSIVILGLYIVPSIIVYNFPAMVILKKMDNLGFNETGLMVISTLVTVVFLFLATNFFRRNLVYYNK